MSGSEVQSLSSTAMPFSIASPAASAELGVGHRADAETIMSARCRRRRKAAGATVTGFLDGRNLRAQMISTPSRLCNSATTVAILLRPRPRRERAPGLRQARLRRRAARGRGKLQADEAAADDGKPCTGCKGGADRQRVVMGPQHADAFGILRHARKGARAGRRWQGAGGIGRGIGRREGDGFPRPVDALSRCAGQDRNPRFLVARGSRDEFRRGGFREPILGKRRPLIGKMAVRRRSA